jgi:hypothetical protein
MKCPSSSASRCDWLRSFRRSDEPFVFVDVKEHCLGSVPKEDDESGALA